MNIENMSSIMFHYTCIHACTLSDSSELRHTGFGAIMGDLDVLQFQ
jgi:hypothetical protein